MLDINKWLGAILLVFKLEPLGLGGIELDPYCPGFLSIGLPIIIYPWALAIWLFN